MVVEKSNARTAKSFIHDHLPTMDFCDYPELKRLHGAMQYDGPFSRLIVC